MIQSLEQEAIDAMFGPTDLFLSGAKKIITKISPFYEARGPKDDDKSKKRYEFKAEQSTLTWLDLDLCLKMLGDLSHEAFIDALFLAGTARLEAFPPLNDPLNYQQPFTFRNVVDLLSSSSNNVLRLCDQYIHDTRLSKTQWLNRYMRAVQTARHMIVMYRHDFIKPRTYRKERRSERPPSDLHELIGLALPDELQYYLYRGMIGPRVLGWLISGKIRVSAPLSGGESDAYRKLVREDLRPRREEAIALLAYSINRYFQQREITTSFWFGPEYDEKLNVRDLTSPKRLLLSWRVRDGLLLERMNDLEVSLPNRRSTLHTLTHPRRLSRISSLGVCISQLLRLRIRNFVPEH